MLPTSPYYPDPDRDAFAQMLIRYLRSRGEPRTLRYDPERFALHLDDDQVALEARYQAFLAADGDTHDQVMDSLFQGMRPRVILSLADVLPKLRPVLHSGMVLANQSLQAAVEHLEIGRVATHPWLSDLSWGLVIDESNAFVPVTAEQIRQWSSRLDALLGHAQSIFAERPVEWRSLGAGLHQAICANQLAASRLLSSRQWLANLSLTQPVALAPARNCLLVADATQIAGLQHAIEIAESWALDDVHGLPPIMLQATEKGWEIYTPAFDSPVFPVFRAVQMKYLSQIYREQAFWLSKQDRAAYFPELAVARKAGEVVSYTVFSEEITEPQWLPVADEIAFFPQDESAVPVPVKWAAVAKEGLLKSVGAALNPPRYSIGQFPSQAWFGGKRS